MSAAEHYGGNSPHFFTTFRSNSALHPAISHVGRKIRSCGKCIMRICLLCRDVFPSIDSGEKALRRIDAT